VAKILVADDNSNIQKMVGLALKDQGIDVVAVGNGEAAVRKISDIHPDLVLADVFMPVRNGYEVCQYVKTDSTLSHIPVILLVGAFDPLDEQEAQRVGADGVLKKPFVPPDPLISMVKSALTRAGVSLTPASAPRSVTPARIAETAPLAPRASVAAIPEVAATQSESFVEDNAPRPPELKIDSGVHPPAFGSLLETPAVEEEQEPDFATERNPALAPERDWRSADVEEEVEEEEEEEPKASWRRDAGDEAFADNGISRPVLDWRDIALPQSTAPQPVQEKTDVAQVEETQDVVVAEALPAAVSQEPPTPEPLTAQEDSETKMPVVSPSETVAAEPEKPSSPNSWFSVAPSPWEAEAQKASHLASAWDTAAVEAPKEAEAPAVTESASAYANEPMISEETTIPPATVEAIREEAAHVAESATQETSAAGDTAKTALAETDMEAMVAKVLTKLSPDVLQALTREILKPVIESIVKDELNAKKP
jgi:CheY-like chemotaxis protein